VAEDDELYQQFGEFLHENEGGIDALRERKRKQAIDAVRRAETKRRRRELDEAHAWFAERRKDLRLRD